MCRGHLIGDRGLLTEILLSRKCFSISDHLPRATPLCNRRNLSNDLSSSANDKIINVHCTPAICTSDVLPVSATLHATSYALRLYQDPDPYPRPYLMLVPEVQCVLRF